MCYTPRKLSYSEQASRAEYWKRRSHNAEDWAEKKSSVNLMMVTGTFLLGILIGVGGEFVGKVFPLLMVIQVVFICYSIWLSHNLGGRLEQLKGMDAEAEMRFEWR